MCRHPLSRRPAADYAGWLSHDLGGGTIGTASSWGRRRGGVRSSGPDCPPWLITVVAPSVPVSHPALWAGGVAISTVASSIHLARRDRAARRSKAS